MFGHRGNEFFRLIVLGHLNGARFLGTIELRGSMGGKQNFCYSSVTSVIRYLDNLKFIAYILKYVAIC